jgi:hypothetical protein
VALTLGRWRGDTATPADDFDFLTDIGAASHAITAVAEDPEQPHDQEETKNAPEYDTDDSSWGRTRVQALVLCRDDQNVARL